jgi:hypothetical protein
MCSEFYSCERALITKLVTISLNLEIQSTENVRGARDRAGNEHRGNGESPCRATEQLFRALVLKLVQRRV